MDILWFGRALMTIWTSFTFHRRYAVAAWKSIFLISITVASSVPPPGVAVPEMLARFREAAPNRAAESAKNSALIAYNTKSICHG